MLRTTQKYTFDVTRDNFKTLVLQSTLPVLVDFWAEWCPPCHMIAPSVDEIAHKYQGKLLVGKLDIDAFPDFPELYDVYGFPTLLIFQKGQPVYRIVGFQPRDRIEAQLAAFVTL